MKSAFVGRITELELINDIWESPGASFLLLYGRRRIGKTRLLTQWLNKNKGQGLYWMAEATSAYEQLSSFSQALAAFESPDLEIPLDFTYPNWDFAFRKVASLAQDRQLALFIDEATYLIEVNPSWTGALQKAWDHHMNNSQIVLALCGSQMGLVQKQFLTYGAPLYGRPTVQMQLPPLPFGASKLFFPNYSARERVMIYAIWGGVPAYWERLNENLSVLENLQHMLSPSNAWMMDEARLLLQDFVNDPHNYVGVMRAIAQGNQTFGGIRKRTGMSTGHTSRYLNLLRDTSFVQRRTPVSDDNPDSRRGRYFMTDPYLRFHYRFLTTFQSSLALGEQETALETIKNQLPEFIHQNTWPELCREWLMRASARTEMPLFIEKVGGDWGRKYSIETVGISKTEKNLVLGVCHWDDKPASLKLIKSLLTRAKSMLPAEEDWSVYFVGFSSSGWPEGALEKAEEMLAEAGAEANRWHYTGIRLIDLEEVDNDLARWST